MSNAATLRTGLPTKATVAETINRSGRIAVAILALGAILRVNHYLGDRALWGDEAMLASNFAGRDFGAMLQGLATEHQMAPFGFLLLEKFVVDLFGDSAYALRLIPLLAGFAMPVLLLHPLYWALSEAARASPYEHENIRAALRYVIDRKQAGDVIFVYRTAQANIRFYAPCLRLAESAYRQGAALPSDWPAQRREFDRLIGAPRVWLILAKRDTRVYAGVEERFLAYADERGVRRATFLAPGASAYLYDFTVAPPAPDGSGGPFSAR